MIRTGDIMNIFTRLTILTLLSCSLLYPQSGFDWTKQGVGAKRDYVYGITTDAAGNVYATGEFFSPTLSFAPATVFTQPSTAGRCDFYIAKLNPEGSAVWGFQGGGTLTDRGYGVVVDPAGNLFVTGHFYGQATFGSFVLNSSGNLDAFTAKFDAAGSLLWIKEGKSVAQASTRDIALDANGNFYITGYYGSSTVDSIRFDNLKITTNGQRDIFLVKCNNDGVPQWGKTAGGWQSGEQGNAVTVDPFGNIYMTGVFLDTATFDHVTLFGAGTEIFLAKYSPEGNLLWAKSAGGPKADHAYAVVADPFGNVYIAGGIDSIATFDTTTVLTSGGVDAYVAKYDASGNFQWLKTGGGALNDAINDLAANEWGDIFGIGYFNGPAVFGDKILTGTAGDDVFFVRYNPEGNVVGIMEASGLDNDRGVTIALDKNGNLYGGGSLRNWIKFGADSLNSNAGVEDIFITKIFESALPVELVSFSAALVNNSVKLTWTTATEINNSGFQIERKSGSSWENIGFVNGKGSTSEKTIYSFIDKDVLPEKYSYRLKQIDYDGTYSYSKEVEVDVDIPSTFELSQNYPNPFNPATTIKFSLPAESFVTLSVFNSLGEETEVILHNTLDAGKHSVNINAHNYSSGVYVYVIKAVDNSGGSYISSKKMIVLK
jgi:hypothetical protein